MRLLLNALLLLAAAVPASAQAKERAEVERREPSRRATPLALNHRAHRSGESVFGALNADDVDTVEGAYLVEVCDDGPFDEVADQKAQLLEFIAERHMATDQPSWQATTRHVYSRVLNGFALHDVSAEAVAELAQLSAVCSISQVGKVKAGVAWGLDRIDQASLPLDSSYSTNGFTGDGVAVFVLDTGLNTNHDEFSASGRTVENAWDAYDTTPDANNDVDGHGSHCAGTIGGSSVGVAPDCDLYGVKVLGDDGSGSYSDVIAGVEWVVDNADQPAVISMSLGGPAYSLLDDALEEAVDEGVVVVVAAGNSYDDACNYSPAAAASAVTVGSTTSTDEVSYFSNYGECVDIYAPGSDIFSVDSSDDSSYATMSGTSMAAPHVAGVAATMLEEYPDATPAEISTYLACHAVEGVLESVQYDQWSDSTERTLLQLPANGAACGTPSPTFTKAPTLKPTTSTQPTPAPTNYCTDDGFALTLNMYDSWGDGWNGASWTWTDEDKSIDIKSGSLSSGFSGSAALCTDSAVSCHQLVVSSGTWDNEISWSVEDQAGNEIMSGGAPDAEEYCFKTPSPSVSTPPTIGCSDDPDWYHKGAGRNCDWVALKPSKRCRKRGSTGDRDKAEVACPVACGTCPTPSPTVFSTEQPTSMPTISKAPTSGPSASPTSSPTMSAVPTAGPTSSPTSSQPSALPTSQPTAKPTASPTVSFSPTPAPTDTPTPKPSLVPTPTPTSCEDNADWRGRKASHTCNWVAIRPSKRCNVKSTSLGTRAYELGACPATCGTCPTPSPTANPTTSPPTHAPTVSLAPIPAPTSKPTPTPTTTPAPSAVPVPAPTEAPVHPPTSKPSLKPSPAPSSSCADNPQWYGRKTGHDCDWVAQRTTKRCRIRSPTFGTRAREEGACPATCGTC